MFPRIIRVYREFKSSMSCIVGMFIYRIMISLLVRVLRIIKIISKVWLRIWDIPIVNGREPLLDLENK
jgi:hypothetical protein